MVQQINSAALGESKAAAAVAASKRYGNFLGMELGFWYESSAVIPDGTEPPSPDDPVIDYVACARPGHRAPHVRLESEARQCSTIDLFGPGFTVLTGAQGKNWVSAARDVSAQLGIDVAAHTIGSGADFRDPDGDWAGKYGVDEDGALLVRPDGHVGWRSASIVADPREALMDALRKLLAR